MRTASLSGTMGTAFGRLTGSAKGFKAIGLVGGSANGLMDSGVIVLAIESRSELSWAETKDEEDRVDAVSVLLDENELCESALETLLDDSVLLIVAFPSLTKSWNGTPVATVASGGVTEREDEEATIAIGLKSSDGERSTSRTGSARGDWFPSRFA